MLAMFLFTFTGVGDINTHEAEMEAMKHLLHEPLKYVSCISQAKQLVQVKWRCKDSLWNVFWCHSYVVIRPYQIKLREKSFCPIGYGEVMNVSDRVMVR